MNKAKIHYYDIGDYLSREDKLRIIKQFGSIERIPWTILQPNEHGDWINHRNEMFKSFIPIEPEKKFAKGQKSFFTAQSCGVVTSRDAWVYGSSKEKITSKINQSIIFYNNQVDKVQEALKYDKMQLIENLIDWDETKFKWDRAQKERDLKQGNKYVFTPSSLRVSLYRPFFKQWLYFNRNLNNCIYQLHKFYPSSRDENLLICISGIGSSKTFSVLISKYLPCFDILEKSQCFPLYWYEESKQTYDTGGMDNMFVGNDGTSQYERHDGVTDWILSTFRKQYGYKATKEDIFYYVYGLLHSQEYRTMFATDLKKSLPRMPLVEKADDFWAFCKAGRELADLHLNYETVEPYRKCQVIYAPLTNKGESINYHVDKMRFGKIDSKTVDKSIIYYNNAITIEDIPVEAYEYVVNGKSAIEWVMERYAITTDKKSGIINDPNDWAREHNDEKYIFNLLLRIINVSVQTVEIVKSLPRLKFE